MSEHRLLWGDFHTHLDDLEAGDTILRSARDNIDFCAVLMYPFAWERKNGFRVESVGSRPGFPERWERIGQLSRAHYDAGEFTTFAGYEWHGDRTRYGDHNVIYPGDDAPLDDTLELPRLFENLRQHSAFALPHHTAYATGWRGKDWSVHDADLSPVMEVFSSHGSSEGVDTPYPLESNGSMAPRVSGGTWQDALARGLRVGVIASNDGPGLPGRWGKGRAAVWADDCTREAIWEAIAARRTYAVTGDRIELGLCVEGQSMGGVATAGAEVEAQVSVTGSAPIDRVELLLNGVVAETYNHAGRWERRAPADGRYKVRIEAGWGPATHYGYPRGPDHGWQCRLDLEGARLVGMEPCFTTVGSRIAEQGYSDAVWNCISARRGQNYTQGMTQSVVAQIEGDIRAVLHLDMDGEALSLPLAQLREKSHLVPLMDEVRQGVRRTLGLGEADVTNADAYYHNARKILVHRAAPESAYRVQPSFTGLKLERGTNYVYARVTQVNGQMAWSSPVWIEHPE